MLAPFEGLRFKYLKADRYNSFFHPNFCHVCKFWSSEVNMISCYNCDMIAYCCERHMIVDQKQHVDICNAIKKLIREGKMRNFHEGTREEWLNCKKECVRVVEQELARSLLFHEEQMLLFAKSCHVCYKETSLKTCPLCLSVNYCEDHKQNVGPHKCAALQTWLATEIQAVKVSPNPPRQFKFINFPNANYPIATMNSFYDRYIRCSRSLKTWTFPDFIHSDYLSGPLTLYDCTRDPNVLQIPNTEYTYIIHIIATSHFDRLYLRSWEIFLHVFIKPTKLVVIMVGPNLQEECEAPDICKLKCKNFGHTFHFLSHRMLYHDYVNSSLYRKPDVIIRFHVELADGETWAQFLAALEVSSCPLVITAESNIKAQEYRSKIGDFSKQAMPIIDQIYITQVDQTTIAQVLMYDCI
ncbi:hypothetical protein EAI_09418 [Harpegnathos saltator]|uniref:Mitochondrial splicing suppressor 51-like C-terminal domain-containing protein n=1 Tax=Harpegnathos saltator TaxID=610380 RepID=E2BQK1_HARSA|nr:hypothetical protein EAI_09418 [Harpegnathos saltator]